MRHTDAQYETKVMCRGTRFYGGTRSYTTLAMLIWSYPAYTVLPCTYSPTPAHMAIPCGYTLPGHYSRTPHIQSYPATMVLLCPYGPALPIGSYLAHALHCTSIVLHKAISPALPMESLPCPYACTVAPPHYKGEMGLVVKGGDTETGGRRKGNVGRKKGR